MHDLIYAFVRRLAEGGDRPPEEEVVRVDTLKDLHAKMIAAYREQSKRGWPSGPNDGYFFSHLRDHLDGAGMTSELADLAMSPAWLEVKHRHKLIGDALADLRTAYHSLPEADGRRGTLKKLELALRKDIDFIDRYQDTYPQGLLQCLWNRLRFDPQTSSGGAGPMAEDEALVKLVKTWRNERRKELGSEVFLSLNQPLPDPLETNLIRVFRSPPDAATGAGRGDLVYGHLLDISDDGGLLACYVSGAENQIRIWTMETGAFTGSLPLGDLRLSSFRFEPSGTAVFGVCHDGTVRTWDCNLKQEIVKIPGPFAGSVKRLTCSSISTDGRLVAGGSAEGDVQVWYRDERGRLWECHIDERQVTALAFDLPSKRLLVGDDAGIVSVYDAKIGDMTARWTDRGSRVTNIASDGNRVYIGSADGHVIEWNIADGSSTKVFSTEEDSIASLALDHDATRLGWALGASMSRGRGYAIDRTVYVKDLNSDDAGILQLAGNPDDVRCLVIRNTLVASTGNDWQPHLWDTALTINLSRGDMIYTNDVQDAGADSVIAAGDDGTARIFERRTLAEVLSCRHGGPVWSAIALAETPRSPAIRSAARPVTLNKTVIAVTAGEGDRLKIWDACRQQELSEIASSDAGTMGCRGTRDCAHLVFGNTALNPEKVPVDWSKYPQDLTLWSAEAGEKVGSFHVESAMEYRQEIVVTPDNHLLIMALDHLRLGVWSLWAGELMWASRVPTHGQILAVALHPAGRLVAAGDISGNLYIYSTKLDLVNVLYNTHHGYVRGLAFTDDGRYLVSGSDDQSMKIWSIPDYTLKGCVELGQWITCLTTSFGLSEVIVGLNDGNLRSIHLEGMWDWGPPIVTAGRRWRVTGYTEEKGRRKLVGQWSKRPSATCPFCGREVIAIGAVLEAVDEWEATLGKDESPCVALPEDAWKDGRLLRTCRGCSMNLRWNPFQLRQPKRN